MRKRILLVIGIVAVVAVVASVLVVRQRSAKRTKTAAPQLVKVERGSVRRTVTADGTLKALTSVDVKSDAGGKVILLAVEVGDKVKKGDLLAKIDPTNSETAYNQAVADMQSSQAQLSQAQAEAQAQPRLTRSTIAQAQAAYDSAVADLKRLQNSTQPRDRADARATLDRAQASVREAQENLVRMNVSTHPVSRSSAQASLNQAQASLRAAQETVKRLKQAQHPQAAVQAKASLDKAKSALSVAEKELKRSRELNAKGYLSQSSLETAEDTCESARAAYAEAQEVMRTVADDQSAELRAAEADVDQAQAALAAAQKKWASLDDDQSAEARAAEAQLQQAQADLASAQRQWATLDQDQAEQLAASHQAVKKARAALDNARADAMQVRVKAEAVVSQRAQLVKAAAEVNDTRTTLSYTTITAPRDGVILSKDVEEGTIVNSGRSGVSEGTSIVTLGDLSTMYVDVDVDETDLADISVDQQVEIEVDSVADKVLKGRVTRVDPQAETTSNVTTVPVEIEVLDHDKRLLPGLSATCTFLVGERTNVLTLPTRAIRQRDGKTTVTMPGDPSPRVVMVEVGLEGDETTEIVSGLNEGDQVILPQLGANTGSDMGGPPPGMGGGFLKSSSK